MAASEAYDPLDRRQRVAAAILMSAVDLPQPAADLAKLMIQAAALAPGVNVQQVCFGLGRRACLERARDLITAMLEEIG